MLLPLLLLAAPPPADPIFISVCEQGFTGASQVLVAVIDNSTIVPQAFSTHPNADSTEARKVKRRAQRVRKRVQDIGVEQWAREAQVRTTSSTAETIHAVTLGPCLYDEKAGTTQLVVSNAASPIRLETQLEPDTPRTVLVDDGWYPAMISRIPGTALFTGRVEEHRTVIVDGGGRPAACDADVCAEARAELGVGAGVWLSAGTARIGVFGADAPSKLGFEVSGGYSLSSMITVVLVNAKGDVSAARINLLAGGC